MIILIMTAIDSESDQRNRETSSRSSRKGNVRVQALSIRSIIPRTEKLSAFVDAWVASFIVVNWLLMSRNKHYRLYILNSSHTKRFGVLRGDVLKLFQSAKKVLGQIASVAKLKVKIGYFVSGFALSTTNKVPTVSRLVSFKLSHARLSKYA